MVASNWLLLVFLLLVSVNICAAHYNLKYPFPYNRVSCKGPESWCQKACPPIWKSGSAKARNSPDNPSATWSRGQEVTIEWHKNNHEGGFYRRSLVPVKHMFSTEWHIKTAFDFGCWSQGTFQCGKSKECGTDKRGRAYRNKMIVPTVVPDGDYVFAMVWYGGLDYKRSIAKYSDYTACAYIRIKGGNFEESYKPVFQPGIKKPKGVPAGTCQTTSSFVLECGGGPCENKKPYSAKPGEFQDGKSPSKVLLSQYDKNAMADAKLKESSQLEEEKAIAADKKDAKEDEKTAMAEERDLMQAKKAQKGDNTKSDSSSSNTDIKGKPNRNEKPEDKKATEKEKKLSTKKSSMSSEEPSTQKCTKVIKKPETKKKRDDRKKSETKNSNNSNKSKMERFCRGRGPPKSRGSWGPRYTKKWYRKRRVYFARRYYCRKCRGRNHC